MPPFLLGLASALPGVGAAGVGVVANIVGAATTGAIHVATSAITAIGGLAVNVVGNVVRTVAALPGLVINTVGGLFSAINNGGGAIVGALLKVGTVLGGLASGGLAAFAKYLQISVRSMMDFARNTAQLRISSGLSLGTSGNLLSRLGGFGIGADAVNGALGGQPAALWRMRAGMFGLPGLDDPGFAAAYSARRAGYMNGGLGGQMMGAAMDRILGTNSPQFQMLALMSRGQIAGQQAYTDRVNAGIGPEALRRYAVDVPLVLNRITSAFDAFKMKAAVAALPVLDSLANGFANLAAQNMDSIVGGIQSAVQWLFVKAPLLAMEGAQWVIGAAQTVVARATEISDYLAQNLPQLIGNAVQWLTGVLNQGVEGIRHWGSGLVNGFADVLSSLTDILSNWMQDFARVLTGMADDTNPLRRFGDVLVGTIDIAMNSMREFAAAGAFVSGSLNNSITLLSNGFELLGTIPRLVANMFGRLLQNIPARALDTLYPGLSTLRDNYVNYLPPVLPQLNNQFSNPVQMWMDTRNAIPVSDLGATWSNWANSWSARGPQMEQYWANWGNNTQAGIAAARGVGLQGVGALANGLQNATTLLAPLGERLGQVLQPHLQNANEFLVNTVQPNLDALSTAAAAYKNSLGTEQERTNRFMEQMVSLQREEVDLMRQQVKNGGSIDAVDRTAAYMLRGWLTEQTGALRRAGGGSAG